MPPSALTPIRSSGSSPPALDARSVRRPATAGSTFASASPAARSAAATRHRTGTRPSTRPRLSTRSSSRFSPARAGAGATPTRCICSCAASLLIRVRSALRDGATGDGHRIEGPDRARRDARDPGDGHDRRGEARPGSGRRRAPRIATRSPTGASRSARAARSSPRAERGYQNSAGSVGAAEQFRMQATDLGRYLLYDSDEEFLADAGLVAGLPATAAAEPSDDADWTITKDGSVFEIVNQPSDRQLAVGTGGALVTVADGSAGAAGQFTFSAASGCPQYPEVEVNASRRAGDRLAGLRRGDRDGRGTHARDGVRVPRRQGPLWAAVASLRRPVRARRLRRPRGHRRLRRGAGERALRQPRPLSRRRRLADLRRLAGPEVADPRAVLLQVAGAGLARRHAPVRQPDGREPGPVRALPAEAEQLRRDGQRAAPDRADPRARGLHRRPERRARARAGSGSSTTRSRPAR